MPQEAMTPTNPPVVLLHGLGRTQLSMAGMARFLRRHGYHTWMRTYPSRRLPVRDLAEIVGQWIIDAHQGRPVHVVTHSLGGILVRHLPKTVPLARVVMLAPPNNGSALAAALDDFGPFSMLYGPAGQDVARAQLADWPLPHAPVGVVAGTRASSLGNPVSWLSGRMRVFGPERPNDGTVAVDETRLPGMVDFAEVDTSHTWIMNDPRVRNMTLRFLQEGQLQAPVPQQAARTFNAAPGL
ncbi:MAG: alpha/beta fold hydrolase [Myxococcales bacterium]|nr:alpha/beta fold hydrolase [Myxococcales bacterium]